MKFGTEVFTESYVQYRLDALDRMNTQVVSTQADQRVIIFDLLACFASQTSGWYKDGSISHEPSKTFLGKVKDDILPRSGIQWNTLRNLVALSHPWFSDVWNGWNEKSNSFLMRNAYTELSIAFKSMLGFSETLASEMFGVPDKEDRQGFLARVGINDDTLDIDSQIKVTETIFRSSVKALKQFTYDSEKPSWNACTDGTPLQLLRGKEVLHKKKQGTKDTYEERARSMILRDFAKVCGSVKGKEISLDKSIAENGNPQYAIGYEKAEIGKGTKGNEVSSPTKSIKPVIDVPELPEVIPEGFNFDAEYNRLVDVKTSLKEAMSKVEAEIETLLEKQREADANKLGIDIAKALQDGNFAEAMKLVKLQEVQAQKKAVSKPRALTDGKEKPKAKPRTRKSKDSSDE